MFAEIFVWNEMSFNWCERSIVGWTEYCTARAGNWRRFFVPCASGM